MKAETLETLLAERAAKRPIVLATNLDTGEEHLIHPDGAQADDWSTEDILVAARRAVRADRGEIVETGYDVAVVDPRRAFGSADRFPGVTLSNDWPDEAIAAMKPDARTAVVALTHDPKIDDPALSVVLRSDVFYIGALGSRKTHAGRLVRLRERGFDDAALARIHGPIGLDIGARSPAEIAIAILAQMTERLRKADAA